MYVVAGEVRFDYGDEMYTLSQGDSAYFDAQVEHRVVNPGTEPAQVLCVFGGGNGG